MYASDASWQCFLLLLWSGEDEVRISFQPRQWKTGKNEHGTCFCFGEFHAVDANVLHDWHFETNKNVTSLQSSLMVLFLQT